MRLSPHITIILHRIKHAYFQMALIYDRGCQNYEKSKYYYMQIIEYDKYRFKKRFVYDIDFTYYCHIADLSCKYGKYDEALEICNTLIGHLTNKKILTDEDIENKYMLYKGKAEVYKEINKLNAVKRNAEKALLYINESIEKSKTNGKDYRLSCVYEDLSEIYTLLGRTKEADEAMAKSRELGE